MLYSPAIPIVIFVLGMVNVLSGTALFFSCRCVPTSKLMSGIMKRPKYQRFYKYHCSLWWILWPSVIIHAVLAFLYFGSPF